MVTDHGSGVGHADLGEYTLCIAVLTFRRPQSLQRTLDSLQAIPPDDPLQPSRWKIEEILVIDNDDAASATDTVQAATVGSRHPLRYHHEPEPGLAAARNRALDEAQGDVMVFIDDDEEAGPGWPGGLIEVMLATGAALVGGPVRTEFDAEPPPWIVDAGAFDRPEPPDRSPQTWLRSGNLAIDLAAVRQAGVRFDPAFSTTGGEDVAFSRAVRAAGLELSWSASAIVTEHVGPERTTLRWITRRERVSTTNWVRVELAHKPGLARRALVAARGLARIGQGAVLAVAGGLTLDRARAATGLVTASRGVGSLAGLVAAGRHRGRSSATRRYGGGGPEPGTMVRRPAE